jgi:fructose PTS system EIIA component
MDTEMKELDMHKIINEDLIDLNLQSTTKLGVLKELTHLLYKHQCIDSEEGFMKAVLYRENEGVTGLEKGIAIPHGKSESVTKTSLAIGRTQKPVEWESMDGNPIEVIFLFAVKTCDSTTVHIRLLQKVATLLADDEILQSFQAVKTKQEVIDLLLKNNA